MTAYKLVVVSPFNDYKAGDQIYDEKIVRHILDKEHQMHEHDDKCRKVFKSEIEKQMYVSDAPENKAPLESVKSEDAQVKIETIKSDTKKS